MAVDHRAEAEKWLAKAEDHRADGANRTLWSRFAIAHALLAAFPADDFSADDFEVLPTSTPVSQEDQRPHSRACGYQVHPHGNACHSNCPTCGGMERT
jgi:hypothetical protein